jgi:ssrA-binding protein
MLLAKNKKANYDFFVEEKIEAGIELRGTEVKSAKEGKVSLKESFVRIIKNEIFIMNMHITNYKFGNINNSNETRVRKLLLNKNEIKKIQTKIKEHGYTIVPIEIYKKNQLIKLKIGIARGKKKYDKREILKKKEINKKVKQELKKSF